MHLLHFYFFTVFSYENLLDPLNKRKNKLAESLKGNQLFRDIDDELAWIREKEQVAASTNRGVVFFF